MSMGIRKYPLLGGNEDGSKVVYPLDLGDGDEDVDEFLL